MRASDALQLSPIVQAMPFLRALKTDDRTVFRSQFVEPIRSYLLEIDREALLHILYPLPVLLP